MSEVGEEARSRQFIGGAQRRGQGKVPVGNRAPTARTWLLILIAILIAILKGRESES